LTTTGDYCRTKRKDTNSDHWNTPLTEHDDKIQNEQATNPRTLNKGHLHPQGTSDTDEQSRLTRRTRGRGTQHKTTQTHRPWVCTHMRTNSDRFIRKVQHGGSSSRAMVVHLHHV